jgi:protoporphyrinogen oxidase
VDKNFPVTFVENSEQPGGLAAGFPLGGTSLEKTYHHLFLTDTSILNLVEELGLKEKLPWCDSSVGIFRDGKIHSFKTPLDLLRFAPCSFIGRRRTGFTAQHLKHRKNWRGFTRQTAHAWMTRACGRSAMETIWTPLPRGKFDRHYQNVSMAWFWTRIHIRANSRSGGGDEKPGYFRGGFERVIQALETELRRRGVKILTGAIVEKISGDRTAVISGETMPFDFCVFTGPSPAFARLLPAQHSLNDYAAKLRSIKHPGAACLVFTRDQNLGDFYWINVNEPDAPFLVFLNHTRLVNKSFYGGKHEPEAQRHPRKSRVRGNGAGLGAGAQAGLDWASPFVHGWFFQGEMAWRWPGQHVRWPAVSGSFVVRQLPDSRGQVAAGRVSGSAFFYRPPRKWTFTNFSTRPPTSSSLMFHKQCGVGNRQ